MAPNDGPARVSKWVLLVGALVLVLLVAAAIVWAVNGGYTRGDRAEWVTALGSDDGVPRIALIVVGEATIAAAILYVVLLVAQDQDQRRHQLLFASMIGAGLLAIDGALLASIGWVASPFMAENDFGAQHPFVKVIELLLAIRTHVSFAGGSLIGIATAWTAIHAMRIGDLPKTLLWAGIAAGALAIIGGALLVLGAGAILQTLGVIGAIGWAAARSGWLVYRAARNDT